MGRARLFSSPPLARPTARGRAASSIFREQRGRPEEELVCGGIYGETFVNISAVWFWKIEYRRVIDLLRAGVRITLRQDYLLIVSEYLIVNFVHYIDIK